MEYKKARNVLVKILVIFLAFYFMHWMIATLVVVHWILSIIVQSLLHHRGAAHRMYQFTSEAWKKTAFWFAWLAMNSSYLSPRAYGILHRMHHAYADTDLDPHRPYPGPFGLFKTMWQTRERYRDIFHDKDHIDVDGTRVKILDKFKKNSEEFDWPWFDMVFHRWEIRVIWIVIYVLIYYSLITTYDLSALYYGLIPLHATMGPAHGVLINYVAHLFGNSPHQTGDTSRNVPWFISESLDLFGEWKHNNHHHRSSSADFSLGMAGMSDNGYRVLKLLERIGVVKIKKPTFT